MMTIEQIKTLVANHGGNDAVIAFIFDNEYAHYFLDEPFSESMLEAVGDDGVVKLPSKVNNKKTGMNDIAVTVCKPTENIQGIIFFDDIANKEHIDKAAFRMR